MIFNASLLGPERRIAPATARATGRTNGIPETEKGKENVTGKGEEKKGKPRGRRNERKHWLGVKRGKGSGSD